MTQPNVPGGGHSGPAPDPRLAWFASGGRYDRARPDAGMAGALETAAGAGGRPPREASDDEVTGMAVCWQAVEAHAHARMLAAVREIIRRRAAADGYRAAYPGDLPRRWGIGVAHEVAAALRVSWQAAAPLVQLAWELEARLPGAGQLLDEGVLTGLKAKIIAEEFTVLDDEHIALAQKLLMEEDLAADEMTPGRLRKLCQRIADTVDPAGARKRREDAARDRARVAFFRAHGGDAAMFAEGLPPDEALRCQANIQARAADYHKGLVYPEAGMDFLRVLALVDLINGTGLDERTARYHAEHAAAEDARNAAQRARDADTAEILRQYRQTFGMDQPPAPAPAASDGGGSGGPDYDWPGGEDDPGEARYGDDPDKPAPPVPDREPGDLDDDCCFWPGYGPGPGGAPEPASSPDSGAPEPASSPDSSKPGNHSDDGDGDGEDPGHGGPGGNGPRRGGPGGSGPGATPRRADPGLPALAHPGLPALAHLTLPLATLLHLADRPGEAPGYGSTDPALTRDLAQAAAASPRTRFCLTITDHHGHAAAHGCARLLRHTGPIAASRDGPPPGRWHLTPDHTRPGPDGGYGTWILTVPAGTRYRLDLHPVPVHHCDHRYATDAYRPTALLRHLVEVRDGECSFPGCSHPASRSDFEHARPHHQGGATDACNTGPCSRRCHQVKQSPGWSLTQPEPGQHQWSAPSGRTYTKGAKKYPV